MNTDEMPAGRELDALVAEKVMGWYVDRAVMMGHPTCFESECCDGEQVHHYSTDIAAAWQIIEKFKPSHGASISVEVYGCASGDEWIVNGPLMTWGERPFMGRGPTAMVAICRAALRAVGV